MEFFDPENEVWIDKKNNEVPLGIRNLDKYWDVQIERLGPEHFVLWARKDSTDKGDMYCFDKSQLFAFFSLN